MGFPVMSGKKPTGFSHLQLTVQSAQSATGDFTGDFTGVTGKVCWKPQGAPPRRLLRSSRSLGAGNRTMAVRVHHRGPTFHCIFCRSMMDPAIWWLRNWTLLLTVSPRSWLIVVQLKSGKGPEQLGVPRALSRLSQCPGGDWHDPGPACSCQGQSKNPAQPWFFGSYRL